MSLSPRMRTALFLCGLVVAASGSNAASADEGANSPARQVVATYFHRTQRCPTCQKVGSELERVIQGRFAAELQDGRLAWRQIDFQAPENASYVSAFQITGPVFLMLVVEDNRIVAWKPAPKTWSLLGDPDSFSRYVEAEIRSVLPPATTGAAEASTTRSSQ